MSQNLVIVSREDESICSRIRRRRRRRSLTPPVSRSAALPHRRAEVGQRLPLGPADVGPERWRDAEADSRKSR